MSFPFARRCAARLEWRPRHRFWGRCSLERDHDGYHALERGFDVVLFETRVLHEPRNVST